MGVFGRILEKKERFGGIFKRDTGEKQEKMPPMPIVGLMDRIFVIHPTTHDAIVSATGIQPAQKRLMC